HSFEFDPSPYRAIFAPWIQDTNQLAVHGVGMHMHALGSGGRIEIRRPESECLLSISRWDINWASGYMLDRPRPFELGRDRLYVECRYDNTAGHQSWIDGEQR